jgi:hypothetical protein
MITTRIVTNKAQDSEALACLCATVNPTTRSRFMPPASVQRFQDWVAAWRAAASWEAFAAEHAVLVSDLNGYIHAGLNEQGTPYVRVTGYALASGPRHEYEADELAVSLFAQLVTNPRREFFGGPCLRCERYFVKSRRKQDYCSRKCHSAATAKEATKKRLEAEHTIKLELCEQAREQYMQRRLDTPWQKWVAAKATELMRERPEASRLPNIKSNFVTRNIAPPTPKGEL